jgi:hypothetical protein
MSEGELALAFLSGVVTGVVLDRWVLPPLVDAWVDRLRRAGSPVHGRPFRMWPWEAAVSKDRAGGRA